MQLSSKVVESARLNYPPRPTRLELCQKVHRTFAGRLVALRLLPFVQQCVARVVQVLQVQPRVNAHRCQ